MDIAYKPELPKEKMPIYIIGAGSIVKDAHQPAYAKAGFQVSGITNRTRKSAENLGKHFDIPKVYDNLEEMLQKLQITLYMPYYHATPLFWLIWNSCQMELPF